MSILTRFANRVWGRRLARDLEDEVTFHIDMRTAEYLRTGVSLEKATTEARERFGDVEAVMTNMRKERLTSTPMLLTMTAIFIAGVMSWLAQHQVATTDLTWPSVRAVSIFSDPNLAKRSAPPPRPPPPPTWSQFVKQTKAFEALQKGPGRYSPGRLLDDEGRLIDDKAIPR